MSVRGNSAEEYAGGEFGSAEPFSLVDRNSSFDGTYTSERDLRIEGTAKGAIDCKGTLYIAEGAKVDATIDAEHLTIAGDLTGEIRCRGRLQVMPSGRLRGTVSTQTLIINEGAIYEGQLEMPSADETPPTRGSVPVPIGGNGESRGSSATTFIRRMGSAESAWETPSGESGDSDTEPGADTADRE
jgi:cytoskeletal protein CcmA (bactofilin family)